MKFRHLALGLAAVAAAPAWAQTSVTLWGIVDLAARSVSNEGVGSMQSLVSGSNATSRIAVVGKEDLGGGLGAGFHLEHGLQADTGEPVSSKFWDRRSTLSLTHQTYGELRLGRDQVPSYTAWTRFDPFSYVGVARSANFVTGSAQGPIRATFGSNLNTTVRTDNAAQYLLPGGLSGWEGGLMAGAGEGGDPSVGAAKVLGARLGYAAGPVLVAAAYTRSENAQTTDGVFDDTTIGGAYAYANLKLAAAWRRFEYSGSKQEMLMLAGTATFGAHEVKASWVRNDLSGHVGTVAVDANDADQFGLGYVYSLSKRSALYATLAQISNDGAARYTIAGGPSGMAGGGTSRGVEAGIRHRF